MMKINSTSLILSMDHTIIEALTSEITSMNKQAMIVTSAYNQARMSNIISSDITYNPTIHEVSDKDLETLYVEANTHMLSFTLVLGFMGNNSCVSHYFSQFGFS